MHEVDAPARDRPTAIVNAHRPTVPSRFFQRVHRLRAPPFAPSVSAATATTPSAATPLPLGTAPNSGAIATPLAVSPARMAQSSAPIGNSPAAAPAPPTAIATNAPAVATKLMVHKTALEARRSKALTPYLASAWLRLLREANLDHKYPDLAHCIEFGFDAGIRVITSTFVPANSSTIEKFPSEFSAIIEKEYARGRHIGPLSQKQVEELIGPFQSSPLSLVPKEGKTTLRMVQNLSYPSKPIQGHHSINSTIDSDMFPCAWGTFATICLLITRLPPGSQAAIRDVAEAHRTIPILPSQWPGLVVRLPGPDSFNIDTCDCFGLRSATGIHGKVGDAGAELMRARGIGPVSKWSDDHIFFRILREKIADYNAQRRLWSASIRKNGGRLHAGGRYWYRGDTMPDGAPEEFDEDASFPVCDLSLSSPRSAADSMFSYCMDDVDRLSQELGIPWETSKDIPFASEVPFIGFLWNLTDSSVSIPARKKSKYLDAIVLWESRQTHTLEEVQKLYGKLLHASLIIPMGRAYLTNLETMLGIFHNSPFKPRTPPPRYSR
jgi:hypothetical protein